MSNMLSITNGVPQGSILGPLLFLVYINDFPSYMKSKCILYADDTTLITSHRDFSVVDILNKNTLRKANTWFDINKLTINENKTNEIIFSLNSTCVKSVKLLGIHLDSKLNWESHTEKLCVRLSRVIYLLRKLKLNTQFKFLIQAYFAFFHSILNYGVLLWGNSTGSKQVFILQKKAVRCIMGIHKMESCRNHFKNLKIMTLPCLFILQSLLYVKDNLNSLNLRSDFHSYDTRQKDLIDNGFTRLNKVQVSFKYVGLKLFNMLPPNSQNINKNKFKNKLQDWLIKHAFYSIEEFIMCKDVILF